MYHIIIFHFRAQALFPPSVNIRCDDIFLEIKEKWLILFLKKILNKKILVDSLYSHHCFKVSSMASYQMRQTRHEMNYCLRGWMIRWLRDLHRLNWRPGQTTTIELDSLRYFFWTEQNCVWVFVPLFHRILDREKWDASGDSAVPAVTNRLSTFDF